MLVSSAMPTAAISRPNGMRIRALTLVSKTMLPMAATTTRTSVSGRNARPVFTALHPGSPPGSR